MKQTAPVSMLVTACFLEHGDGLLSLRVLLYCTCQRGFCWEQIESVDLVTRGGSTDVALGVRQGGILESSAGAEERGGRDYRGDSLEDHHGVGCVREKEMSLD